MNQNQNQNQNHAPRPYTLLKTSDQNLETVPWLERFETFLQRAQQAQAAWAGNQGNPHWTVTLNVNGHEIPGVTGQGQTLQAAKADLVRQLEVNRHAVLSLPLHEEFQPIQEPGP